MVFTGYRYRRPRLKVIDGVEHKLCAKCAFYRPMSEYKKLKDGSEMYQATYVHRCNRCESQKGQCRYE